MSEILDVDVCQARHQGNIASIDANPDSTDKQRDREMVLEIISKSQGVTSKEIAEQMGRRLNCISGRISELKQSDLISVGGRRGGCGINFKK
jgi:predicted HTH transcriptional regulator|tara:strand:+ start:2696 stop:2971 length:276 start_codon:yes stop_codon:yes gene_type:complete